MPSENKGLIINRLPSPTWNRLGVNRALAQTPPSLDDRADYLSERNTFQVDKKTFPTGQANEFADSFSGGIRREKYIAGKTAIYQEQHFASGLGAEFDAYINESVGTADVYTVEEGKKLAAPVVLTFDFGGGADTASMRIIRACKDSESVFIINRKSAGNAAGFFATMTKVIVEHGAKLHLINVNLTGAGYTVLDDTAAAVGESAEFDFTQLMLGGDKIYAGCYADLCGDKSVLNINAGYAAESDNSADINYIACHRGKKTVSKINVSGSLKDKAVKVFRDTIDFRNGSAGSEGDEREDVLLLSPKVTNKTVPVILTEEEEVSTFKPRGGLEVPSFLRHKNKNKKD